ncbi:MAG TPA: TM0106 family RecB-like putative nuclease [Terriglobales bacterium]|nr:TM0106 family RecB-like putative nuclease [Terriglobales bacterium]
MQLIAGQPVFAATDLVGFLACEHLVGLELAALAGLVAKPTRLDPEIDLIARRGIEHEVRYLAGLETAGRRATRIDPGEHEAPPELRLVNLRRAAGDTLAAIRRGDDVVYQATFFDGRWLGLADFLLRVDRPSPLLGDWSYEVVDTKLARHVKASALLQICSYVEQLTEAQGVEPEWMHVALGGSARAVERHRVADYMAYYRMVKAAFEVRVAAAGLDGGSARSGMAAIGTAEGRPLGVAYPPIGTYPEPVEHCDVCRWSQLCAARRRADDDLSLVAGAPTRMRKALKGRGVATRRGLARLELPLAEPLDDVGARPLETCRDQARIQVRGQDEGAMLYELLPPSRLRDGSLESNRGLTSLPPPRPGDLFFDIEGDPFALDDGVDYLFGILEPGVLGPGGNPAGGEPAFHAFWAVDGNGQVTHESEKRAFEQTIDLMMDRLARDPEIHIYHYAPYETTAAGRLMGRHGTRELEVDRLLRGKVFVDLYRAVRQGLRASVESYSIKKLEPLYGLTREESLRDAGSSIVAFEAWLAEAETGTAEARLPGTNETLRSIEAYNRDDCVSNWRLRDWLEERRPELARQIGEPLSRPGPAVPEAAEALSEHLAHVAAISERLCQGVSDEAADRTPAQHASWLLAQLLSWHRREEKAFWWRFFHLMNDLTDEERIAEREPIGGLELVECLGPVARSTVYRYRFPEQEHAIDVGTEVCDPATGRSPGSVVALDAAAGTLDLRRGPATDGPHPTSLVPSGHVATAPLRDSLLRVGEWVADHGIDGPGEYQAARELLLRRAPRTGGGVGEALCRPDEEALDAALRIAPSLAGSCLAVQGPPGSGKTYLGAAAIVELVLHGRVVGVTANSHKVIGHLLDEVAERAAERGVKVSIGQKTDMSGGCTSDAAVPLASNAALLDAIEAGELDVVGGTAWVWSRPEFAARLDTLVVDEAGQLSLANAVAVSPAARNLVLLGDPQQLDQPLQGAHPPGAEASALGHVLGKDSTMPADRGLFLEHTRRLHPDLCRFTSEAFYEGRLEPAAGLEVQDLEAPGRISGTGVRFVPAAHVGNASESPEEAELVAGLVRTLVEGGATWTDKAGVRRPLTWNDVLIVAPYNAQVAEIERRLPAARVGTVDKFQGQEAPVSVYSMTTSGPEEAPRGMEFLYSLNRLNVATSRARCLAAVIASPALIRVRARTPRQMRLANALCRFVELAMPVAEVRPPDR